MIYTPENAIGYKVFVGNSICAPVEVSNVYEVDTDKNSVSFYVTNHQNEMIIVNDDIAKCTIKPNFIHVVDEEGKTRYKYRKDALSLFNYEVGV